MTSKQFAALEAAIQQWADDVCETDHLAVVWGESTVTYMATAARSVLEATEESQEYGQREGLFRGR